MGSRAGGGRESPALGHPNVALEPDLLKGNAGTRQDRPNQVRYAFNRRPPAHKGEHRTTSGAFEVLGAREVNELADVEEAGTWLKRR
jgi:hypothetical protein